MNIIKRLLNRFGYQLISKQYDIDKISKNRAENFPKWLEEAKAKGVDVNVYINEKVGDPKELLDRIVFPYIGEDAKVVIEVGPGTGRFASVFIDKIKKRPGWKFYMIDHSQWIITFLTLYFSEEENVLPILNDGLHFPKISNNCADLVFSNGMFIELNLSRFYTYCSESFRTLKSGGYLIFNYIDLEYDEAWEHMKKFSENPKFSFSYYTSKIVDKVFLEKGFELINRSLIGNSTYVVYRKP
jgi:phospholipid N-methyltransferase